MGELWTGAPEGQIWWASGDPGIEILKASQGFECASWS